MRHSFSRSVLLLVGIIVWGNGGAWIIDVVSTAANEEEQTCAKESGNKNSWLQDIVVIKVGGSSITNKAVKESLNQEALEWFAQTLALHLHDSFVSQSSCLHNPSSKSAFVVVHGAGSFGHHSAKEYNLTGQFTPPAVSTGTYFADTSRSTLDASKRQRLGLAKTRISVQMLNQKVVSTFVDRGIHAVAVSPCFGVPWMQAHGGTNETIAHLQELLFITLQAGLVPVLHGDACLYGDNGVGILSGDILVEMIASKAPWVSRTIFLTDVDGVYSSDPRTDSNAELLSTIQVDASSGKLLAIDHVDASGSSHEHDVTGGLKVRQRKRSAQAIV